jgi:hypothetical protein
MSTAKTQAGEEDDSLETFAECQILNPGFYVARPFSATSCAGGQSHAMKSGVGTWIACLSIAWMRLFQVG